MKFRAGCPLFSVKGFGFREDMSTLNRNPKPPASSLKPYKP